MRQSVTAISHTNAGTSIPPSPEPADIMAIAFVLRVTNQLATVVVTTRKVPNDKPRVIRVNAT